MAPPFRRRLRAGPPVVWLLVLLVLVPLSLVSQGSTQAQGMRRVLSVAGAAKKQGKAGAGKQGKAGSGKVGKAGSGKVGKAGAGKQGKAGAGKQGTRQSKGPAKPVVSGPSTPLKVAEPNATAVAQKRVGNMINFLYYKYPRLARYLNDFREYGIRDVVSKWLPLYNVIILAPNATAYNKMPRVLKDQVAKKPGGWLQVLSFHVWFTDQTYTSKSLNALPLGTQFSTGNYPSKGIYAYCISSRANGTLFNGKPIDTWGAQPKGTLYKDTSNPKLPGLIVVETDVIMMPVRLF